MELEITPEPSAAERIAIEQALARVYASADAPGAPSPWRMRGVLENVGLGESVDHSPSFDGRSGYPPATTVTQPRGRA